MSRQKTKAADKAADKAAKDVPFYAQPAGQIIMAHMAQAAQTLWPSLPAQTPLLRTGFFAGLWPPADWVALYPPPIRTLAPDSARAVCARADKNLPFADARFARALLLHALPDSAAGRQSFLREIWRVLQPEGKLLILYPRFCGMWRFGQTPFAAATPLTRKKLDAALIAACFEPLRHLACLPLLPHLARYGVRLGRIGVSESVKRLYIPPGFAPARKGVFASSRRVS